VQAQDFDGQVVGLRVCGTVRFWIQLCRGEGAE
jgi:hypothetical protein